jgi:hypothetical protein
MTARQGGNVILGCDGGDWRRSVSVVIPRADALLLREFLNETLAAPTDHGDCDEPGTEL